MSGSPAVSGAALAQAEALWRRLKPRVVEIIEQHQPSNRALTFNDIESNSASVGDLVARLLMAEAVLLQAPPTAAEEQQARTQALAQAEPAVAARYRAEELRMTRIPDKPCELHTARGPVPHTRTYLYFPELNTGIFPPRPTPGHPAGQAHAAGRAPVAGARRRR